MPYTVFLRRRFDDTVFIIYTPVIEAGISFYIRIVVSSILLIFVNLGSGKRIGYLRRNNRNIKRGIQVGLLSPHLKGFLTRA